jgi:hypothetical protein
VCLCCSFSLDDVLDLSDFDFSGISFRSVPLGLQLNYGYAKEVPFLLKPLPLISGRTFFQSMLSTMRGVGS